jgi:hypothetical protein
MLERISNLKKLRMHLQLSSERFDDDAAKDVSGAAALEQLRIAAECRNLDREIDKLTNRLWKSLHH